MKRTESEVQQEPAPKKVKKSSTIVQTAQNKSTKRPTKNENKNTGDKKKFEKSSKPIKDGKPKFGVKSKPITPNSSTEKTDWKEFKKERKVLKEKRKSKKLSTVYDVTVKAKKMGEKLRREDCSAEERLDLTTKLHKLFVGNFNKLVFTHDISRVIQWLIKYASPELRQSIINELKPSLLKMFESKYAANCVKKALKYGSAEIAQEIFSVCHGHVVKLVTHSIASPIFDFAYKTWASEQTKIHLKQEFYGDMYKCAKDDKVKTLTDVFEQASSMKPATLAAVKLNLIKIINKKLLQSEIVHSILAEFLAICSTQDRSELIEMLRSHVVELSTSKDGVKAAMLCIWHGIAKDRKLSLKALNTHVKELAISEHGHLLLLAMFDAIDDTVLMKKILIPELVENIKEILMSEFGKKVILYLVARRDPLYFHPNFIEELKEGDGNATSKKPADIRARELLEAVIDPLTKAIAEDPEAWLINSSVAMVTLAILKTGCGEHLVEAFKAISTFIITSKSTLKEEKIEFQIIEHPGLHMMLKKLIIADKNLIEKNKSTFGEILIEYLDGPTIKKWIEFNRACFLLVLLIETESEKSIKSLIEKIKLLMPLLKKKQHRGAAVLLKKIQ